MSSIIFWGYHYDTHCALFCFSQKSWSCTCGSADLVVQKLVNKLLPSRVTTPGIKSQVLCHNLLDEI